MIDARRFGAASVPSIGQGTWQLKAHPRADAVRALRAGLDAGLTHVDTAEMYGDGLAEEIVGEAIRGRRDEVFVVSKVLPQNASRRGTVQACERSLTRLGIETLDCHLLHWRGRHPLADTIAAFEELRESGKIRAWGVSNFDASDLGEALAIAGPGRIACNQVLYHLQERAIEHEVVPWCEANGVAVVAYSPFGSGSFPSAASPGGRVLAEIAAARGATPRQVALRFLVRRESVLAIPKAARAAHALDNAGALRWALQPDEIARIDAAFPLGAKPRRLPTI